MKSAIRIGQNCKRSDWSLVFIQNSVVIREHTLSEVGIGVALYFYMNQYPLLSISGIDFYQLIDIARLKFVFIGREELFKFFIQKLKAAFDVEKFIGIWDKEP